MRPETATTGLGPAAGRSHTLLLSGQDVRQQHDARPCVPGRLITSCCCHRDLYSVLPSVCHPHDPVQQRPLPVAAGGCQLSSRRGTSRRSERPAARLRLSTVFVRRSVRQAGAGSPRRASGSDPHGFTFVAGVGQWGFRACGTQRRPTRTSRGSAYTAAPSAASQAGASQAGASQADASAAQRGQRCQCDCQRPPARWLRWHGARCHQRRPRAGSQRRP